MAENKCKGCQSFCMLGHQLVLKGPNGNTNCSDGWLAWKDVTKDKSISSDIANGEGTTYAVSQSNQQQLVTFIKNAYKEGKYCPAEGNIFENSPKGNGLTIIKTPSPQPAPSSLDSALNGAVTGNVIYEHHYNDLLDCISSFHSPIATDPKGDSLAGNKNGNDQGGNNASDDGPVVGWHINADDLVVSGTTYPDSDLSLIKADLYKGLYDKASKLMYHPYQCNVCNIYEGGEWLEIVQATWTALKNHPLAPLIYYTHAGSQQYISLTVNGDTCDSVRVDCSGTVGAAVYFYGKSQDVDVPQAAGEWSTPVMGKDGEMASWVEELGFEWIDDSALSAWQPGDIQVNVSPGSAGHTQIVSENTSLAFSGGGDAGLNAGGPSSGTSTPGGGKYNGVWRK